MEKEAILAFECLQMWHLVYSLAVQSYHIVALDGILS